MDGPEIIVRTMSQPAVPDKYGNVWQYHSRSDRHSKIACWAILFDLLQHSSLLPVHAEAGKITFGINREMREFRTNRTKDLDLVISRPGSQPLGRPPATMTDLAARWGIDLTGDQRARVAALSPLQEGSAGNVLVALEAKACMTAHVKALPRLFDELTSSYSTVHGDTAQALAVGFVMINISPTFLSSDRNKYDLARHQPTVNDNPANVVTRTLTKVREISRRTTHGTDGFDAFGAVVISMANDGSPVTLVTTPPAPRPADVDSYERMIGRVAQQYDTTFFGL